MENPRDALIILRDEMIATPMLHTFDAEQRDCWATRLAEIIRILPRVPTLQSDHARENG